ncbi:GNAT family N-acetyltransferase [Salinicoccus hispanicus]|uniref:GNAT family N-acetyltransferase n=1 Tax=Salinicoccus hispanicus TaxID=157225 RepID=A0A6N8U2W2_9STAP|nr:GNAT family N-acetyltransferase [Salinicoccus hispanicus]MXQ52102.1 GNAT family N-acetyltransferase [Salinicoccus hispanicus]
MWHVNTFEELDTRTLEEIYRLRVAVFVVEQECAYQEIDGKDANCTHIYKTDETGIIAYLRIVHETPVSIGRVIVRQDRRKGGLGQELMRQAMDFVHTNHQGELIYLHGQAHLEKFYQSFGFRTTSDVHLEDGIPHIDMEYKEN